MLIIHAVLKQNQMFKAVLVPGGVISKTLSGKQIFTERSKNFISLKVVCRLKPLKMYMSTDAVLLLWKYKHDFLSVVFGLHVTGMSNCIAETHR